MFVTAAITRTVALNRHLDNFGDIGTIRFGYAFGGRKIKESSKYPKVINFRRIPLKYWFSKYIILFRFRN